MVLASAGAIINLSSTELFHLNLLNSGQRSPLSVYAYSVSKTLCQPFVRLQIRWAMNENVPSHPPQYLFGTCVAGRLGPYFIRANHRLFQIVLVM